MQPLEDRKSENHFRKKLNDNCSSFKLIFISQDLDPEIKVIHNIRCAMFPDFVFSSQGYCKLLNSAQSAFLLRYHLLQSQS
jgi:hypothetical protein